jgi:hypothetical protein
MVGEFRTSMGDLLFLKTERYMDHGVAYMPHLDEALPGTLDVGAEPAEEHGGVHVHTESCDLNDEGDHAHESEHLEAAHADDQDDDHAENHAGSHAHDHADTHGDEMHAAVRTLIPTERQDFRGLIGRLHREIKPWRDPSLAHDHADNTELLPWYRLATLADPQSSRAYSVGAWWLKDMNFDEAVRFVEEGIRNNPDAFQLHLVKGRLLYMHGRDLVNESGGSNPEGERMIAEASVSLRRSTELALAVRPPLGVNDPNSGTWDDYLDDDALEAARLAVLIEEQYGDESAAHRLAREYAAQFGGDAVLERHFE